MAVSHLRSIRFLHTFCNLDDFSQYRELSTIAFFPGLWRSLFELLLISNYYETTLQVFLNTVYFYRASHSLEFDRKHKKIILKFTHILINRISAEVKQTLNSIEIFNLLKDVSAFIKVKPQGYLYSLSDLLSYTRIQIIERHTTGKEIVWGARNPYFQVHVLNLKRRIYFLHPKTRVKNTSLFGSTDILSIEVITPQDILQPKDITHEILETASLQNSDILRKTQDLQEFQIDKYCSDDLEQESHCREALCSVCMKKLKRSSHFLINLSCCTVYIYNSKPVFSTEKEHDSLEGTSNDICTFCYKTCRKPEFIQCICCFLDQEFYSNTMKSNKCKDSDLYKWVDISSKTTVEASRCGFCNKLFKDIYMCRACAQCGDQVCLACLRRNNFIAEGTCTPCGVKRVITFNNI